MSHVSGPVSTLPGCHAYLPPGTMCDDHPSVPAVARIQGETDSMGAEYLDLCAECVAKMKAPVKPEDDIDTSCDWCKSKSPYSKLVPTRDYDEGTCGPVYYVCRECKRKDTERYREERDELDDWYDGEDF